MSESSESVKFIDKQRELYGSELDIEKVINTLRKGVADISAVYKGMPLYAESKLVNSISLVNLHEFSKMQLRFLAIKANAGAMCIGLFFCDKRLPRFIMHDKLKAHITKEEYLNAEEFNWEILRSLWIRNIQTYS